MISILEMPTARRRRRIAVLSTIVLASSACGNAGADRVLTIASDGVLTGFVYFDGNATRQPDAGDQPLPGVGIALVASGTADTVLAGASGQDGLFAFPAVPVGNYRVLVDTTTFADTAVVARIDTADVSVRPGDSVSVNIAISFPLLNVAQARAQAIGVKVFVDGIALNASSAFGDSTIHIADSSGTIRAITAGPVPVSPGDSVRMRAKVASRNGEPVLDLERSNPVVLAIAGVPPAELIGTGVAAAADGGRLDAGFVRVDSARIVDTVTVGTDLVVTVEDGSGPLEVVLDGDIAFNPGPFLIPGADVAVAGVLVPTGSGRWQLKPRSNIDLAVTPTVLSIAEARSKPLGTIVFVDGIALNTWATFGDSTVHISDATASVRGTRVSQVTIQQGDSVRFVGTMALRQGQPVVDGATPFRLGRASVPAPVVVSTGQAATANGGPLDAALVGIANASITDTATVAGDYHLSVNDGSGIVVVVLDRDVFPPFNKAPLVPGAVVNVRGVLLPAGLLVWRVKPRAVGDLTVQ